MSEAVTHYLSKIKGSYELLRHAERAIPGGTHSINRIFEPPLCFARAEGAYVWDIDGNQYIDYHCAFGPIILGHCYPEIINSVINTLSKNDLYGAGVTELEIRLCDKIVEHVPSAERVLLCSSGSEATYHAIRVARAFTRRKLIIKFQGCYHGWHGYVLRNMLSMPEKIGKRDPGSAGMLDEEIDSTLVCTFNDLSEVEHTVATRPGQIAAIILEPIPHNIGCVLPEPGFLEGLRQLCDREGIVLIFDEVITGFRHSLGGYQKICGVTPDLTTLGKAMANGFPIAALAGRATLMDHFNTRQGGDVFFGGTYNGFPPSVAAALATIEILETKPVYEHIFRLGERMRHGLTEIVDHLNLPATVAGFGSVYTLYFMEGPIKNYSDLMRNNADLYVRYRQALISRGIFELPVNLKRNHITFSHTDEDIDRTLEAAEDSLKTILAEWITHRDE
jgi:glutamate-1-semialdehyde 2,1-aminomutase